MVANQAVEDYCFSKILMYIPDLKTDTDRLSDAIELLRNHRYRILNNQSLEASKSMGINWIAGLKCALSVLVFLHHLARVFFWIDSCTEKNKKQVKLRIIIIQ